MYVYLHVCMYDIFVFVNIFAIVLYLGVYAYLDEVFTIIDINSVLSNRACDVKRKSNWKFNNVVEQCIGGLEKHPMEQSRL